GRGSQCSNCGEYKVRNNKCGGCGAVYKVSQ
ncbi:50S ribosomal protein L32, partial [Thiolapillus sp.]